MTFANTVLDRCDSTNDLAKKLGESGAPHGVWISSRLQDKGRGRLGREWMSLEGNLFLSIVLRIENKSVWSWVPMATAVAIHRVIRNEFPQCDAKIKWPNDLWIDGAKIGGILCEGVGNRDGSFIVVGIGLNCVTAPEGLDQRTESLAKFAAQPQDLADRLRPLIVDSLLAEVQCLTHDGAQTLMRYYDSNAAFVPGTAVEWGADKRAKVVGLGTSGELKVVHDDGTFEQLFAEDVKLKRVAP